jgi:hypothetical protein
MKQFVLRNRKAFGIGIAIYNLLGGIAGLILLYTILDSNTSVGTYIVISPIIALYIVSLLSGIFYFRQRQQWRFYFLSKLTLCMQVIQLTVAGFAFIFYYGPYLAIGFDGEPNFLLSFQTLTINFLIQFGDVELQSFKINLIPVLLLIILRWLERNPVLINEEAEHFLVGGSEAAEG